MSFIPWAGGWNRGWPGAQRSVAKTPRNTRFCHNQYWIFSGDYCLLFCCCLVSCRSSSFGSAELNISHTPTLNPRAWPGRQLSWSALQFSQIHIPRVNSLALLWIPLAGGSQFSRPHALDASSPSPEPPDPSPLCSSRSRARINCKALTPSGLAPQGNTQGLLS